MCNDRRPDLPENYQAAASCLRRPRRFRRSARCGARSAARISCLPHSTVFVPELAVCLPNKQSTARVARSRRVVPSRASAVGLNPSVRASAISVSTKAGNMNRTNDPRSSRADLSASAADTHSSRCLSRDELPVERANDRVAHQPRLVRQKHKRERDLSSVGAKVAPRRSRSGWSTECRADESADLL